MASPICHVKDGAGSFVSTVDGVDVTPGNTITIGLVSAAGVRDWSVTCIGTDELLAIADINSGLSTDSLSKTATFTEPVAGSALLFQSTIVDTNGVTTSTTFGIYSLAGGKRVGATGETTEGSSAYGWLTKFNAAVRAVQQSIYWWRNSDVFGTQTLVAPTSRAGSFTVGCSFSCTKVGQTITGVRTYWAGGATTLRAKLWDFASTTLLKTVDVAVSGAGVVDIPFASSYTVDTAHYARKLVVTIWDTAASRYTATTISGNIPAPGGTTVPFLAGPNLVTINWTHNAAGDAFPSSIAGTEYYLVDPILGG